MKGPIYSECREHYGDWHVRCRRCNPNAPNPPAHSGGGGGPMKEAMSDYASIG